MIIKGFVLVSSLGLEKKHKQIFRKKDTPFGFSSRPTVISTKEMAESIQKHDNRYNIEWLILPIKIEIGLED